MSFTSNTRKIADHDIPPWEREEYVHNSDKPNNPNTSSALKTQQKAQEFHSWTFESNILLNDWCTANTAIVYSYMLSRYIWFKEKGKDYFESQDVIMKAVHLSESTIKRSIKSLKDNGYITVKPVKGQHYKKNVYVVLDKHGTYANLNNKTSTITKARPKSKIHHYDDDDDSPF